LGIPGARNAYCQGRAGELAPNAGCTALLPRLAVLAARRCGRPRCEGLARCGRTHGETSALHRAPATISVAIAAAISAATMRVSVGSGMREWLGRNAAGAAGERRMAILFFQFSPAVFPPGGRPLEWIEE